MNCSHSVVIVEQFNPLGAAVSCLFCTASWQMSEDRIAKNWHAFESREFAGRSPSGKFQDPPCILLHRSLLKR